jgi:hypothetical protein
VWDWVNVPKAVLETVHSSYSISHKFSPGSELKAASLWHLEREGKSTHVRKKEKKIMSNVISFIN